MGSRESKADITENRADSTAGMAAEGRQEYGTVKERGRKGSPVWAKSCKAAIPWLLILPLLTMDFKWQALLSGMWVFLALLIMCLAFFIPKSKIEEPPQKNELLDRTYMYQAFWKTICELTEKHANEKKRGLSVAVTGMWGAGKSHFINSTIEKLGKGNRIIRGDRDNGKDLKHSRKFHVANVNLWQSVTTDEMWNDVADSLTGALNGCRFNYSNFTRKCIAAVCEFIKIPIPIAIDAWRLLTEGREGDVLENNAAKHIRNSSDYYMLVLDNIDRCNKKKQRALFPLIEKLSRIPHLVVLCGVAKGEMATIMGKRAPMIDSTLLKIYDLEIPIPPLAEEEAKKYRKTLMGKESLDNTLFGRWYQSQDFMYSTPRVVKKIMLQLRQIEKMYLNGKFNVDDDIIEDAQAWEKCKNIFNFEAIRLTIPNFKFPFPDYRNDQGEKYTYSRWQAYVKNEFLDIDPMRCDFGEKYCFQKMAKELSEADDDIIDYISAQEYTKMPSLDKPDYLDFINKINNGSLTKQQVASMLGGSISQKKILDIYAFCVSNPTIGHVVPFMYFFHNNYEEIHKNKAYFILDFASCLCSIDDDYNIKIIFQRLLQKYGLEQLHDVANIILECIRDKYAWNYDYPELGRGLTYQARKMMRDFNSHETLPPPLKNRYKTILNSTLRVYAMKACEYILSHDIYDEYQGKKLLIIGQRSNHTSYVPILRRSAKKILNSSRIARYATKFENIKLRLLKSIIVQEHEPESTELVAIPFSVLSFAVIWKELCQSFISKEDINENEKSLIGEHIAVIDKRLDMDIGMKKRRSSADAPQFWENRKMALEIFLRELKELKGD